MTENKKCTAPAATDDSANAIINTQSIPHDNERCQAYKFKIITHLNKHGFKHALLGFDYIIRAIELVQEDKNYLRTMTKQLYPALAKEFNSTSSRVERAIRHSIEKSNHYEITNSEFIARTVDELRYGVYIGGTK